MLGAILAAICTCRKCRRREFHWIFRALQQIFEEVLMRKLYPLETYILPILLCRLQFKEVEGKLLAETPLYADARSLLRSGPLGSLRTDIRAVAEYASEAGNGKVASDAVEQCLRALEDLDSLMLRASRDDTSVTIDNMRTRLGMAITALNNLLGTVPAPILDKGEAMILEYTIAAEASPVDSN
ncbi:hypothetical protein O6H91_21G075100 [Diphasiastrum complanatum]|uniref:Uncharacterized protein n=1 Tax=Diphasiastrum complanatum TaxID=34168 RepID=A0ACC2AM66_DIPCM|nr:hypothetical protein O6H91_21G075100 [Diphasiastrum complanatum]